MTIKDVLNDTGVGSELDPPADEEPPTEEPPPSDTPPPETPQRDMAKRPIVWWDPGKRF